MSGLTPETDPRETPETDREPNPGNPNDPTFDLFGNAPFRVCQTVIVTPYKELHTTSDIHGERNLYTAPLSATFEKTTSVNAAEVSLKMGFMSLSGTAIKTGKPPEVRENYHHQNRTANRVAEVTIEGGGIDGAVPDLIGIPVPFSQIADIYWRLYLKVWCDTDPLNPKVEFGGKHDSYPAYEIIVIQSDGSFKDIHRVSPAVGAMPGPDSLDDGNAIKVGRTDTITK